MVSIASKRQVPRPEARADDGERAPSPLPGTAPQLLRSSLFIGKRPSTPLPECISVQAVAGASGTQDSNFRCVLYRPT